MAQVIDPRGDLILVVGGDTAASENPTTSRFLVCSRTLARTSPVFAAMLYGGFAESKPSSPPVPGREWFVRLPGDDCAAMQQLLHLLHGNHDRFTLEPTFDSLYYYLDSDAGNKYAIPQTHSHHENIQLVYDFLVAADKYDCEQYVHLWTPRWHLEVCGVTSYPLKAMLMLAWIFYQLGDRKRYEWMLKCLAFDHESPRVMTEPLPIALPPNLISTIEYMRHSVVDRPLIRLRWRIEDEEYIDCFNEVPFHQLEGDTKATVSARMAGSIQSTLAKYGLWPIPAASAVTCSIMDVRDAISGASTKVQHAEVNGPYVLVRDDLTIRWGDCEVTTAKEDIEYMDSKAAKTGIKKA